MPIIRNIENTISRTPNQGLKSARVTDIILDINHPLAKELGGYDSIGTVFFSILKDTDPVGNNSEGIARPFFSFLKNYPLKNEIILLLPAKNQNFLDNGRTNVSAYYLPNVNIWNHPHHNALPKIYDLSNKSQTQDYQNTQNGLIRKVEDGNTGINLGNYFNERINIKPLLPYEGDIIVEGRFGNSIRFGSTNIDNSITDSNNWSNLGDNGDPITIIRNGQSKELDTKGWVPTIEDINNDDSSIYLTSNQQISNFNPASLNQKSYGANLQEVKTTIQQLTDPTLETIIEPNLENQSSPEEYEEVYQSPPSLDTPGCIDPSAINYNEQATVDDGSCQYLETNILVETKTDNLKINYLQQSAPIGISGPNEEILELNEGLNQAIGQYFLLNQLISSDKIKAKIHPEAVYEKYRAYYDSENGDETNDFFLKDTLGFYLEQVGFRKRIIVKTSDKKNILEGELYPAPTEDLIEEAEILIGGGYSAEELSPPEGHERYTPPFNPNITPEESINNYPGVDSEIDGETIVINLKSLMTNCVDKIIENYPKNKKDFRLKSGYRSKALTSKIGGTTTDNEHLKGQAIDFYYENNDITDVWEWCYNNLGDWHQLMLAYPEKGPDAWIHISYISENENKKFVTLLSNDKSIHDKYNGKIRENNNIFQDGITL